MRTPADQALGCALGSLPEIRRQTVRAGDPTTFHWRTQLPAWELAGADETILALHTGGSRVWTRGKHGWSNRCSSPGRLHLIPVGCSAAFKQAGRLEFVSLHLSADKLATLTRSSRLDLRAFKVRWAFDDAFLWQCVHRLSEELRQPGEYGPMLVESLSDAIWLHLLHSEPKRMPAAPIPAHIARARERIRASTATGVSLDELAQEAGVSRYHFLREFRRAVGEPPHRYLTRCRIEEASALLRDTDRTIVEIALQVGYSSQPHFSTAFHSVVGRTPRQFRKDCAGSL